MRREIETELNGFFEEIKTDTMKFYKMVATDKNQSQYSVKDRRFAKYTKGQNLITLIDRQIEEMKEAFIKKIEKKLGDKITDIDLTVTYGEINGIINNKLSIKTFVAGGQVQCYHLRTKMTILK